MAAWLLGLLLLCARPSAAQSHFRFYDDDDLKTSHYFVFSYRHWFTTGGTTYRNRIQIPAAQMVPYGATAYYGTTQDFSSSPGMEIFTAEIRPFKRFYFDIEFGTTLVGNGLGTTHDWIDTPLQSLTYIPTGYTFSSPDHADYYAYTESLNGRTTLFSANVFYHVFDGHFATMDEGYHHSFDVLFGYSRFEELYHMTNGNVIFSPGYIYPAGPLGPFKGEDSSYDGMWQAPHFGIREQIRAPYRLSFDGYGTFAPFAVFQGRGYDNFSASNGTLRSLAPNYTHNATGMGVEMNLSMGWQPFDVWKFGIGYSLYYYFTLTGYQRDFFPDGSTQDITLDYVRTLRSGLFLTTSFLF